MNDTTHIGTDPTAHVTTYVNAPPAIWSERGDNEWVDTTLEAVLQFVTRDSLATFDFSVFGMVDGDHGSDLLALTAELQEQEQEISRIRAAVSDFHRKYTEAARAQLAKVEELLSDGKGAE